MSEKPPVTSADLLRMGGSRYRAMPKPSETGVDAPTAAGEASQDVAVPNEVTTQADKVRDAYAELQKKVEGLSPEVRVALGADLAEIQSGLNAVQEFYTEGELNLHAEHGDWEKVTEILNGALARAAEISAKIDEATESNVPKEANLEDFSPELVKKVTKLADRVRSVGEDKLSLDAVRDAVVAQDLLAVRDWLSILKANKQTWARALQSKLPENEASSEKVEHELKAVEVVLNKIQQATEADKVSESSEQDRAAREAAATYWRIIISEGLPLLTNNAGRWGKTGEMLISKKGADVKQSVQFFVDQDPAAFHNFMAELSKDSENKEVFEHLVEVIDRLRGDMAEVEEKTDREVPAEILSRATTLGPRLALAFRQVENMTPDELRKHGWEARIKTSVRQMAEYYSDPSLAVRLQEWSKQAGNWDKPLESLGRWERIAEDIETKLSAIEEKTKTGTAEAERAAREADIPGDILNEARQLSVQARAVAERCRTLSAEDRQKLHIRLFTSRELQQIANTYNAENVEYALLDLRREAKDWQEVQQDVRGLLERVSKLQLDMDALRTKDEPSGGATTEAAPTNVDTSHNKADFEAGTANDDRPLGGKEAEAAPDRTEAAKMAEALNQELAKRKLGGLSVEDFQKASSGMTAEEYVQQFKEAAVAVGVDLAKEAAAGPRPFGDSWTPEQRASFEQWRDSAILVPLPTDEKPAEVVEPAPEIEDHPVEQQSAMEQAEAERVAGLQHQQELLVNDIVALWKNIPDKDKGDTGFRWQDVRNYLQNHGGSLNGFLTQARTELATNNERFKTQPWKYATEGALAKDLLDKLLLEKQMLIDKLDRDNPGRAGGILLRREIEQRANGVFEGSWGQSEHPVEMAVVGGTELDKLPDVAAAKDDLLTIAKDKGQMETVLNRLATLSPSASKSDVERIIAPLQQSSHFNFEALQAQIKGDDRARHDKVMVKLPNGSVFEMIRNARNDIRAATVHQPQRQTRPDTQLSIDEGRIQRTGVTEFDAANLGEDRLGWGHNVEVYFSTQDKNDTDSGLLKIAYDNGQWRMVGKLRNEVIENGKPVDRVVQIDKALSDEDLQKIKLRQGEMVVVPGVALPIEKVTDISLRYTGKEGKQVARSYDVLKSLEKENEEDKKSRKDAPKSLRYRWHDQQLNSRGWLGRQAGKTRRWVREA